MLLLLNLLLLFRDSALDSTIYFCEDNLWISSRDSFELRFGNKSSTFDLFEDAPSTFSYGVDLLRFMPYQHDYNLGRKRSDKFRFWKNWSPESWRTVCFDQIRLSLGKAGKVR